MDLFDTAGASVVVAEDDEVTRQVLTRRLEHAGYDVLDVRDGLSALSLVRAQPPEVLITDWLIPGLDGIELCRRLKHDRNLCRVYTIMVTVRDRMEDQVLVLDAGADDFLPKPVHIDELLARVRVGVRTCRIQRELELAQHDRALAEMALALGHEINNPLTSLVGYLDMLLESGSSFADAQRAEILGICREDALRIAETVARLHKFRKPRLTECIAGVQMVDLEASSA